MESFKWDQHNILPDPYRFNTNTNIGPFTNYTVDDCRQELGENPGDEEQQVCDIPVCRK